MTAHDETASRQLVAERAPDTLHGTLTIVAPRALRRRLVLGRELEIGRAVTRGLSIDLASMSRSHAVLRAEQGRFVVEDRGSRHGTFRNAARLSSPAPLDDQDVLRFGDVVAVFEAGTHESPEWPELPGTSSRIAEARQVASRAAHDVAPVLILGETGTGKESAAALLHRLSGRSGPFIPVNCAALASTLIESQLFGHVKGAFSGAENAHPGFFRSAQGGTLFLDELGELPLELQAKLLRVLQERELTPVGASTPVKVDVRVVAATNRELDAEVERGAFRRDLLARLSLWTVRLPPLRARRLDIVEWLVFFTARRRPLGPTVDLPLTPEALEHVLLAPLAENLRALEKLAHLLADATGLLPPSALPQALRPSPRQPEPSLPTPSTKRPTREALEHALAQFGSVRATARHYGRERKQIYRWIEQLGIDWSAPDTEDDDSP